VKKVLILSSAENDHFLKSLHKFVDELNQRSQAQVKFSYATYRDLSLEIINGNLTVSESLKGQPLDIYDLVFFKSFVRYEEIASLAVEFLKIRKIPFVCSELNSYVSQTKLTQYARLAGAGLLVPDSYYENSSRLASQWTKLVKLLGESLIVKAVDGMGGSTNYFVENEAEFKKAFSDNPKRALICQRFIPNEYDLRLIVANSRVRLVIKRQRQPGSGHLNNTSQGGHASLVDLASLDPGTIQIAEKAAAVFNREFAGVDILFDPKGSPVILEVNTSPQIATGSFTKEKLDIYASELINLLEK